MKRGGETSRRSPSQFGTFVGPDLSVDDRDWEWGDVRLAPGVPIGSGLGRFFTFPLTPFHQGRENQENLFAVRWGVLPLVLLLQEVGRHAVFWAYSTAPGELMVPFGGRGQSLGRRFRAAMGSYDLFASGRVRRFLRNRRVVSNSMR